LLVLPILILTILILGTATLARGIRALFLALFGLAGGVIPVEFRLLLALSGPLLLTALLFVISLVRHLCS
jgi:hypothetical protein